MAICRGENCGAKILWIKTPAGKNICCDTDLFNFDDLPLGEVIVTQTGQVYKKDPRLGRMPNVKGYRPHWASCPDSAKFRRPKE